MDKHFGTFGSDPDTARGVLEAALYCWHQSKGKEPNTAARPFLTVSHQPGANAMEFSARLVERLNELPGGDWTGWQNETFDDVALDPRVESDVAQAIREEPLWWLQEVKHPAAFNSRQHKLEPPEYEHVATTLRALAMAGHTVLVGCGGQFITRGMPGGIHLRLITPFEHQVSYIAKVFSLSPHEAEKRVKEAEHNRHDFYQRWWPGRPLGPDVFTLTFNAAELSTDEMVACVLALVQQREKADCCKCGNRCKSSRHQIQAVGLAHEK